MTNSPRTPLMDIIENRHSVRGFEPTPIPEAELKAILEVASRAPSNGNTQPWNMTVLSGDALEACKQDLLASAAAGEAPDAFFGGGYDGLDGEYVTRQHDSAARLYDALGIERSDKEGRQGFIVNNFKFFNAPHVGIISMGEKMNATNALDVGMFLQNFMLLLHEAGYGSVPQGILAMWAKSLYAHAEIQDGHKIIVGISFGKPDMSLAVNKIKMPRAPLSEVVKFKS